MSDQALAGLRVLEHTDFIGGAWCGHLMAGLGAQVVKVEPLGQGDRSRSYGPFPGDRANPERSGLYIYLNTGKKSITLDIDSTGGKERLEELLGEVDCFIVDMKPSSLAERGLTYERLQAMNLGLIMVSITPFGLKSPYAEYQAYDLNIAAAGGLCTAGWQDREPLGPPGHSVSYQAGVGGAIGAMLALLARKRIRRGQLIDLAAIDVAAACQTARGGAVHAFLREQRQMLRTGPRTIGRYPYGIFDCKDGYISAIALQDDTWQRALELIGGGEVPEWYRNDPRFTDRLKVGREYADEVDKLWEPWRLQHSKEEIFSMCQEQRIPWTPIYNAEEVLSHEHLRARDFFVKVNVPGYGEVEMPGSPFRLSETPWRVADVAPKLGQHDGEVLWEGGRRKDKGFATLSESGHVRPGSLAARHSAQDVTAELPLNKIRVVDFGLVRAGPVLAHYFADMGAEVIKVESRRHLDAMRLSPENTARHSEMDPFFHDFNRGKLSITLDLSHPEAPGLVKKLVSKSDLATENFAPGVLGKYGLSYDDLKSVNPGLIMITMPTAGQTGPLKDIRAFGPTLASLTGLDYLVGYPHERVLGRIPLNLDDNNAMYAFFAGLAALRHREETGQGQHIDVAQWETAVATLGAEAIFEYTISGRILGPHGNQERNMGPHNLYPCTGDDQWISIAVSTEEEWRSLCKAMGNPAWAQTEYFSSMEGRMAHQEELDQHLAVWTHQYDRWELTDLLQRHRVAAVPALDIGDRVFSPHYEARDLYFQYEHPITGMDWLVGTPWKLSETPARVARPAPMLGQHNEYVFGELLGLSKTDINRLADRKVIY